MLQSTKEARSVEIWEANRSENFVRGEHEEWKNKEEGEGAWGGRGGRPSLPVLAEIVAGHGPNPNQQIDLDASTRRER